MCKWHYIQYGCGHQSTRTTSRILYCPHATPPHICEEKFDYDIERDYGFCPACKQRHDAQRDARKVLLEGEVKRVAGEMARAVIVEDGKVVEGLEGVVRGVEGGGGRVMRSEGEVGEGCG